MNNYENDIISFIEKTNYDYFKIDNVDSVILIYELLINNIMFIPKTSIEMFYIGFYYKKNKHNHEEMKKYYLMVIDNNDNDNGYAAAAAMNNLALYYQKYKDYEQAEKYFLMAIDIDNECRSAMYNLGYYYESVVHDNNQMEKYYLMAIKKEHDLALEHLRYYYMMNSMYVGTLEKAIEKFILFLCGREIYLIDSEVRQESTGKYFKLQDYSKDPYLDDYI